MTHKAKWIALTACGILAMATSSKLMASVSVTLHTGEIIRQIGTKNVHP